MKAKTSISAGSSPFRIGPTQRRQMPAKAKRGRGSSPMSPNQCQVAGVTCLGSANNEAGNGALNLTHLSRYRQLQLDPPASSSLAT
jgi:hypothetical protein